MKDSQNKNIRWGIILSYISLLVSLAGTLFVTNKILNLVGDYNYGLYSFVLSITSWLTVISSSLISSYLRYTSIEAINNDYDVSRTNSVYLKMLSILGMIVLVIGIGTITILYCFGINFGKYSWNDSKIIYLLFIISLINIAITLPITVFTQFINYKKEFIYEKLLSIFTITLQFAGHLLIAIYTQNIILFALYSIFSTLLTLICNFYFCRKHLNIRFQKVSFKKNKKLVKSIMMFSSVLVLNSIVDQINSQIDKTLLGFFSIPENITIYQIGMQFSIYLSAVIVAVSGVFAPQIHDLCAKKDFSSTKNLFLKVSRIQAIVVCFVAFGFVACGYDFTLWWLGSNRINVYWVGSVLMVLNIMPLSIKLAIEIQRAIYKHKFRSFLYLVVAILNVILSIVCLVVMPSEQAIWACLIGTIISSVICQWIAMNIYNKKVIKLPMEKHWFQLLKQILFGVICTLVVIAVRKLCLATVENNLIKCIIEGLIYVVIYGIFLLIFDKKFIISFLRH